MNKIEYDAVGVCASKIVVEIEDNIIKAITVDRGCSGNSKGLAKLCEGLTVDEVIEKLQGIKCGFKETSCPDQIARALIKYQNHGKDV